MCQALSCSEKEILVVDTLKREVSARQVFKQKGKHGIVNPDWGNRSKGSFRIGTECPGVMVRKLFRLYF